MSDTQIDERIVSLEFDNKEFEKNVQKSLTTLERLKLALKFDKSYADAFKGIEQTSKKVSFEGLNESIETVKNHFSALEIMGVTALMNITNHAIDTGRRMVKALSVDQVAAGFNKYAEKTSSVQTIINSTGKSMQEVSDILEKLNWFTDETSYNFLDMVNNIGKFTSNRIELEKAETAMEGIATWAAISGANSQMASRAMYNISQSISQGSMRLMDWMSIENANMATAEFKQTAIETAAALGTLKKDANGVFTTLKGNVVTVENFRTTLSDAWFTSEAIMQSLSKYGGFATNLYEAYTKLDDSATTMDFTATKMLSYIDSYKNGTLDLQMIADDTKVSVEELTEMFDELSSDTYELGRKSFKAAQEAKTFSEAIEATKDAVSTGWMNIFEQIFGTYEEAKQLWTGVANLMYDMFAAGLSDTTELLKKWKELGGREHLLNAFANSIVAILDLLQPLKEAWATVFPETQASTLVELTKRLSEFTSKLIISARTSEDLKIIFTAVFTIFKGFLSGLKEVSKIIPPIISFVRVVLTLLLRLGASIASLNKSTEGSIDPIEILSTVLNKLTKILAIIVFSIESAVDKIKNFNSVIDGKTIGIVLSLIATFAALYLIIQKIFKKFSQISNKQNPLTTILSTSDKFSKSNLQWFRDFSISILSISAALSILANSDQKGLKNAAISLTLIGSSLVAFAFGMSKISEVGNLNKGYVLSLFGIIFAITGSLIALKNTTPEQLKTAGIVISLSITTVTLLSLLLDLISRLSEKKLDHKIGTNFKEISITIISLSGSLLLLSYSLKILNDVNVDDIYTKLTGVGVLVGYIIILGKMMGRMDIRTVAGLAGLVLSLLEISKVLEQLTKIPFDKLKASVEKMFNFFKDMISSVVSGLVYLTGKGQKIKKFVDDNPLLVGFIGILGNVVVVNTLISSIANVLSKIGKSLIIVGAALKIVSLSFEQFVKANATIEQFTEFMGFVSITLMMLIGSLNFLVTSAIKTMKKNEMNNKDFNKVVLSITMLVSNLISVAYAIKILAGYDWKTIASSFGGMSLLFVAIGSTLAIVSKFTQAENNIKHATSIFVALLGLAISMKIAADALVVMSDIPYDQMLNGLSGFGIVMSQMVGTIALLSLLIAGINKISAEIGGFAVFAVLAAAILSMALMMVSASASIYIGVAALERLFNFLKNDLDSETINDISEKILQLVDSLNSIGTINPYNLLLGIGALAALGLGILTLSFSLEKISKLNPDTISEVLDVIVNRFDSISKLGAELLVASPGFVAFGLALTVISKPVKTLSKTVPKLADGLSEINTQLERFKTILKGSENIFELTKNIGQFVVSGLISGFVTNGKLLVRATEVLTNIIPSTMKKILKIHSPSLEAEEIGDNWTLGLFKSFDKMTDKIKNKVKTIFGTNVVETLTDYYNSTDVSSKVNDFVEDGISGVAKLASKYGIEISNVGDDFSKKVEDIFGSSGTDNFDKLTDTIKNAINLFAEFDAKTEITAKDMNKNLTSQLEGMVKWKEGLLTLVERGISPELYEYFVNMGQAQSYGYVMGLVQGTDEELQHANNLFASYHNGLIENTATELKEGYIKAGGDSAKVLTDSIEEGVNSSDPDFNEFDSQIYNQFDNTGKKGAYSLFDGFNSVLNVGSKAIGEKAGIDISNGLTDNKVKTEIKNDSKETSDNIKNEFSKNLSSDKTLFIGSNLLKGIGMGALKAMPNLLSTIGSVCTSVLTTMAGRFRINSPSKATAEMGKYLMFGLVDGIDKNLNYVIAATDDIGKRTLNNMSEVLNNLNTYISDDMNFDPVVRPVLDVSNLESGASQIASIFNGRYTTGLAASTNRDFNRAEAARNTSTVVNANNSDVVSEISALRNDINVLGDAMSNLKVVMNGDAVVGEIAPSMDTALGTRSIRNRREK